MNVQSINKLCITFERRCIILQFFMEQRNLFWKPILVSKKRFLNHLIQIASMHSSYNYYSTAHGCHCCHHRR